MMITNEQIMPALMRRYFDVFLRVACREIGGYRIDWNFHLDAIIHQFERVRRGDNKRLIITIPPRHLKTDIAIAWVAWMMGNDPSLKFICPSYGSDLSDKHARKCLRIMESDWYRRAFPALKLTRRAADHFETSAGGYRLATSVGGVITGIGADYVVIDDPMKADDTHNELARKTVMEWFDDALRFRLESLDNSAIVLIMQRLHGDDLAGNLLTRGGWHELRLPAIAPADELIEVGDGLFYQRREGHALHPKRQSLAALLKAKLENSMAFASQQMQDPVPPTGSIIQPHWFPTYDEAPTHGVIIQSWDTAARLNPWNAYSVGITAIYHQGRFYILDVCRERMEFLALRERVELLCNRYSVQRLLIERASSGEQLITMLTREPRPGVPIPIPCKPTDDKIVRFHAQASRVEGGQVLLPRSAPWLPDFLKEICGFPNSKFKDQADAFSQLLLHGALWTEPEDDSAPIIIDEETGYDDYDPSDPFAGWD